MNPISAALRRPITVMVLIAGVAFAGGLAYARMKVDIFPALNLPVVYVCQPYGGMDPQQMEGLIANYYEYHFLYINGIHHVESKNIAGRLADEAVLPPRHRHGPGHGRDGRVRQPLAGLHAAGHGAPFIMRFDTGSVPVGYLVLSQRDQDASARSRTRRCSRSGRCSPPSPACRPRRRSAAASGPSSSALDPERLRAYNVSADDVVQALTAGNTISPVRATSATTTRMPLVPTNAMVVKPEELGNIAVKPGVFLRRRLRDPVTASRSSRTPATSRPATPWSTASGPSTSWSPSGPTPRTLDVVNNVRANLPKMQDVLPHGHQGQLRVRPVAVRHQLDQGRGRRGGARRRRWSG